MLQDIWAIDFRKHRMSFVQEKAFSFPNRCEEPVFIFSHRVMFGSSSLYVLHHPAELQKKRKEGVHVEEITYDIAQEEITANSGFGVAKGVGQTKSELLRSIVVGPLHDLTKAKQEPNEIPFCLH